MNTDTATDETTGESESEPEPEAESEPKCGASSGDSNSSSDSDSRSEPSTCGASTGSDSSSRSSAEGSACGASSSGSSSNDTEKSKTREKVGATLEDFDAEPGQLTAVGLGPGHPEGMTERAKTALLEAEHIVGYTTYIELLSAEITDAADDLYDTPMCGEVSRTEEAIDRTLAGNDVAIVGSGDPNVYALAGLALEILESKGATASMVDFEVVPGVPAAQSCGARLGAPLVNDTVSISLSDHLVPMPEIESRLHAAAKESFTITIYNPWSRKRRENFEKCCEILLTHRDSDTPVGIVHGAGREDERVVITELGELEELGESELVDMTTTIVVGNEDTYVWDDRMVTPRGYETKYDY
ncbi:precorrin-3B C(17)-methyltransferase [Halomontanus rarus]|uniref:precorrin-3B C(17)-methyltransferase n=1 Tax=Halomontanus rarus TaxID=3034020 RepID=UPI0023E81D4A|nr:precorrin-3B C(17)-methyltransferase [Halovivax sp. TS33]